MKSETFTACMCSRYVKKHYRDIEFVCKGLFDFLSHSKDRFDLVVIEAIEHSDEDFGFVRLVYELLSWKGVFAFSVPYMENLGNPFHKHFYYSKDKLIP